MGHNGRLSPYPITQVVGFETEQGCQMFADGLALLVAEANERQKPTVAPTTADSGDDLDATARTVFA